MVFGLDAVGAFARRIVGRSPLARGVILYYHRVPEDSAAGFNRQMYLLNKWTSPISADSGYPDQAGARYSAVTFDDAFSDTLRRVLPIMKHHEVPFTVFVPTGFMGDAPGWIEGLGRDEEAIVSHDELLKISDEPLVTIGSHCVTHRRLSGLDDRSAEEELCRSRKDIETLLGKTSDLIAFPHGDFSPHHLEMARRCGYKRAFSIQPEMMDPANRQFLAGRISVEPSDSDLEFILKISGSYRWRPAASRLKKVIRNFFTSGKS